MFQSLFAASSVPTNAAIRSAVAAPAPTELPAGPAAAGVAAGPAADGGSAGLVAAALPSPVLMSCAPCGSTTSERPTVLVQRSLQE